MEEEKQRKKDKREIRVKTHNTKAYSSTACSFNFAPWYA